MKKNLLLFVLTLFLFIPTKANAMGLFYSNATYPITASGIDTSKLETIKKGTASSNNILFLVEVGNAGIEEAAKSAGIKKISHIDVNEKSIFIFGEKSQLPYMASNKRSYLTGSFFYFN